MRAQSATPANLGHMLAIPADGLAALAPDLSHVLAIPADGHAALAPRFHVLFVCATARAASVRCLCCHCAISPLSFLLFIGYLLLAQMQARGRLRARIGRCTPDAKGCA